MLTKKIACFLIIMRIISDSEELALLVNTEVHNQSFNFLHVKQFKAIIQDIVSPRV